MLPAALRLVWPEAVPIITLFGSADKSQGIDEAVEPGLGALKLLMMEPDADVVASALSRFLRMAGE